VCELKGAATGRRHPAELIHLVMDRPMGVGAVAQIHIPDEAKVISIRGFGWGAEG
jgi:hypothetical protein